MSAIDDHKICFIMCTNNDLYMNEALYYIQNLTVPDGYQIDFLSVTDAASMTSGYNEAMNASDAKYKVYLHQDTFIINRNFISDILKIFAEHPEVGLLGCFGPQKMPADGCMWSEDRCGKLWESHVFETKLLDGKFPSEYSEADIMPVEAVDGFLMITQYDIPWRDDLFTKWDFYDASQSMEFIRAGYKVAVPNMSEPWALHDCGFLNMDNYDAEKEIFLKEYGIL